MAKRPIVDKRNRKMQKSGAVTIPADLRRRYGYKEGQPVIMEMSKDGILTIKPMKPYCAICMENVGDTRFKGVPVCKSCSDNIASRIEDNQKAK